MVCLQTKKSNLGKFWGDLEWNMLGYFMAIWLLYILTFGIYCGHLVYVMIIWYIFPVAPRKIWQPCCRPAQEDELVNVIYFTSL
jgi:hypothetical protein